MNRQIIIAGFLGALAVALGAFGAHGLKNQLSGGLITVDQLNGYDTAVKYQMYHTLAILLVAVLKFHSNSRLLDWAYRCFVGGIILFSGSLYLLTTRNLYQADFLKVLGPVTPLGGLLFMAGWIFLALSVLNKKSGSR